MHFTIFRIYFGLEVNLMVLPPYVSNLNENTASAHLYNIVIVHKETLQH